MTARHVLWENDVTATYFDVLSAVGELPPFFGGISRRYTSGDIEVISVFIDDFSRRLPHVFSSAVNSEVNPIPMAVLEHVHSHFFLPNSS